MPATWPTDLPQTPLIEGYSETFPNYVIRSQMDTGPDKIRRRTTAAVRPVTCAFLMSGAQVELLDDFINADLASVNEFTFPHPHKAGTVTARIVAPPVIEPIRGDSDPDNQLFRVTTQLEFMP